MSNSGKMLNPREAMEIAINTFIEDTGAMANPDFFKDVNPTSYEDEKSYFDQIEKINAAIEVNSLILAASSLQSDFRTVEEMKFENEDNTSVPTIQGNQSLKAAQLYLSFLIQKKILLEEYYNIINNHPKRWVRWAMPAFLSFIDIDFTALLKKCDKEIRLLQEKLERVNKHTPVATPIKTNDDSPRTPIAPDSKDSPRARLERAILTFVKNTSVNLSDPIPKDKADAKASAQTLYKIKKSIQINETLLGILNIQRKVKKLEENPFENNDLIPTINGPKSLEAACAYLNFLKQKQKILLVYNNLINNHPEYIIKKVVIKFLSYLAIDLEKLAERCGKQILELNERIQIAKKEQAEAKIKAIPKSEPVALIPTVAKPSAQQPISILKKPGVKKPKRNLTFKPDTLQTLYVKQYLREKKVAQWQQVQRRLLAFKKMLSPLHPQHSIFIQAESTEHLKNLLDPNKLHRKGLLDVIEGVCIKVMTQEDAPLPFSITPYQIFTHSLQSLLHIRKQKHLAAIKQLKKINALINNHLKAEKVQLLKTHVPILALDNMPRYKKLRDTIANEFKIYRDNLPRTVYFLDLGNSGDAHQTINTIMCQLDSLLSSNLKATLQDNSALTSEDHYIDTTLRTLVYYYNQSNDKALRSHLEKIFNQYANIFNFGHLIKETHLSQEKTAIHQKITTVKETIQQLQSQRLTVERQMKAPVDFPFTYIVPADAQSNIHAENLKVKQKKLALEKTIKQSNQQLSHLQGQVEVLALKEKIHLYFYTICKNTKNLNTTKYKDMLYLKSKIDQENNIKPIRQYLSDIENHAKIHVNLTNITFFGARGDADSYRIFKEHFTKDDYRPKACEQTHQQRQRSVKNSA